MADTRRVTRTAAGHFVSHALLPLALCAAAVVFVFSLRQGGADQHQPHPAVESSAASLTLP